MSELMVIKFKPRGQVEVEEVAKQAYQIDDPSPSRVIVDTDIPILSSLRFVSREVGN